ncbi:MAG: hypothetical protein GX428_04105 [Candidatus Atribacteria bacterium]|nr:hypothetical protein [Candidatus Atribacteria bacterium]
MKADLINCKLICSSSATHLSQLFTGFGELEKRGLAKISVIKDDNFFPGVTAPPFLKVVIDDRVKVFYDLADCADLVELGVQWSDVYFKRSYSSGLVRQRSLEGKIFPYGFNYPVFGSHDFAFKRIVWSIMAIRSIGDLKNVGIQTARLSGLLSRILKVNSGRSNSSIEQFEGFPKNSNPPLILFLTRLWNPNNASKEFYSERTYINHMRAECIRKLRKEFNKLFIGGVEPSRYSLDKYKDVVVSNPEITKKKKYLKLVRKSDICVATMGLQGSNGWKLAEYIAFSKAIVTEELQFTVPGNFCENTNFLKFDNADACVEAVSNLVNDSKLRLSIMQNNYEYYQNYLRPGKLVWNTLFTAKNIDIKQ